VNANDVPFENSRSYTDILPSFQLRVECHGYPENCALARPAWNVAAGTCSSWAPVLQYGFTRAAPSQCTGWVPRSASNSAAVMPAIRGLDPFRASQFDLSWEDYFSRSGLISVGYFYKGRG